MTCDTACVRIVRPADEVFDFMADPAKLGLWSLGTGRTETDSSGLIAGRSIRDGAVTYVRIDPHPRLRLIDYLVGTDPQELMPRIYVRVIPGGVLGSDDQESMLTMTAVRTDDMDDGRWADLRAAHAFEIGLVKSAIETGYDHRRPTS